MSCRDKVATGTRQNKLHRKTFNRSNSTNAVEREEESVGEEEEFMYSRFGQTEPIRVYRGASKWEEPVDSRHQSRSFNHKRSNIPDIMADRGSFSTALSVSGGALL